MGKLLELLLVYIKLQHDSKQGYETQRYDRWCFTDVYGHVTTSLSLKNHLRSLMHHQQFPLTTGISLMNKFKTLGTDCSLINMGCYAGPYTRWDH